MTQLSTLAALLALPLLPLGCGSPFVGVDPVASETAGEGANESAARAVATGGRQATETEGKGGAAGSTDARAGDGGGGRETDAPSNGGVPGGGDRGACPELRGEKLVRADGFCIDENEVTVAHYREFLDAVPDVTKQPLACAQNTSFANGCKSVSPATEPQRCVDWCDARAYCESVGKQLCGSEQAGAMPFDAPPAALDGRWYSACSFAGKVAYPYGETYDASACWGADRPTVGALTVKSASGCVGGYAGLFDMSGGLAEWVDSCSAEKGLADACHIRGGSTGGTAEQLRCDWQSATSRGTSSAYIGFRCCAELLP